VAGKEERPFSGKAPSRTSLETMIEDTARQKGVDPDLVLSVVERESSFNTNAKGKDGEIGLMQLMRATAKSLGVKNRYNPTESIEGGTELLKRLIRKYKSIELALSGYNVGEPKLDAYLAKHPGKVHPATKVYVDDVMAKYNRRKSRQ